jgi:hypothetical protein
MSPFHRAVPITPVDQTGACADYFPVRAAFPALYQINRQLSAWHLPPLVTRAFGAHHRGAHIPATSAEPHGLESLEKTAKMIRTEACELAMNAIAARRKCQRLAGTSKTAAELAGGSGFIGNLAKEFDRRSASSPPLRSRL